MTKFLTSFTLLDMMFPTRMRRGRTEENIAVRADVVNEAHELCSAKGSGQLIPVQLVPEELIQYEV